MVVRIAICSRSFVFSQSDVQISAGRINISGLAITAFDLTNCSLSVARFVFVTLHTTFNESLWKAGLLT